ncbi:hypothetical protein DVB73_12645 [Pseudomonas plecoglossicida]|uniref:Uncharacterized protein n=1 Tax=Pseudomonas plecoglossicida TaxID=70775 RepID=A0AAD0VU44_PSEDL|nr:hypothetical protein DVB73_12645 [Pseudomonas plecoglossicida]
MSPPRPTDEQLLGSPYAGTSTQREGATQLSVLEGAVLMMPVQGPRQTIEAGQPCSVGLTITPPPPKHVSSSGRRH